MTAPVHLDTAGDYGCVSQPLCENNAGRDCYADIENDCELTTIEAEVTCRKCWAAMGYEATQPEQLTVCEPDPIRRAA